MDFNEYQQRASKTALAHVKDKIYYYGLGIAGESGEIADKIKKIFRDDNGKITEQKKKDLINEMGDVLWYLSQLSLFLGISFEDIAKANLEKLQNRQKRGTITGDGDNR